MKKPLILFLTLASFSFVFGQNIVTSSFEKGQLRKVFDEFNNPVDNVEGSPFLYDEWSEGLLQMTDSTFVEKKIKFKFNSYLNEVWAKLDGGKQVIILYNAGILSLELTQANGQKILLKKVKTSIKEEGNQFFQVLYEGKNYMLVNDLKKKFHKAGTEDSALALTRNDVPKDAYEDNYSYFLKVSNKPFVRFSSLKRGNLTELAPPSRTLAVEKFCKEHNLKGKLTDTEAVQLLTFLDGLN